MNCFEVIQRKQRLDTLFKDVSVLKLDPEMQAHWARYLCILVAGFLESSIRAIHGQYAQNKASVTARYVMQQLKGFQNANMEKVYQLTGAFSDDWRKSLEKDTEGQLREAVDSIVANRHNIAHGRDVNISFVSLRDYYRDAVKVLEMIDKQCAS